MALSPIRVAPGGRYFETADGEPFLFIGANDSIAWQGLNGLYDRRDVPAAEAYLQSLADSGVTILRLMLEYAEDTRFYFERPAGCFDPLMVQLWDDLFARCERLGLRTLIAPWDNFWMGRRWESHPYNAANGGPAASRQCWFTDPATIECVTRRFQFVVERWGKSGVIAAWDLFNEIDPFWGGSAAEQQAVVARWSRIIRETELRCWGWTRLQTVSVFGPEPKPEYHDFIFANPDFGFATTHIYHPEAIDNPRNTVAPALSMARWTRFGLENTPPTRPFTDTEHGPIALFNNYARMLPEAFDDEFERHLMWAHLASGGAGSGLRWPARHPHILTPGMKRALFNLSQFARFIDWRHFTPHDAREQVKIGARGVLVFAVADARQAVIWLLRGGMRRNRAGVSPPRTPRHQVKIALGGLSPGDYSIEVWDTQRGALASLSATVGDDGILRTVLPRLENDLALAIRRRDEETADEALERHS